MTVGIYLLSFEGTNDVYIGQSTNIEKRYKDHLWALPKGRENKKITLAYKIYGIPKLNILQECLINELDDLETVYIEEFDSYNNGLNASRFPTNINRGEDHFNSIYSNETIAKVLLMLIKEPLLPFKIIARELNVKIQLVESISSLSTHSWLEEVYPLEYSQLKLLKNNRRNICNTKKYKYGKSWPPIQSPVGTIYYIENGLSFAKEHNLNPSHLCGVLNGVRKSHLGWKLYKEENIL
jgi:hypothetical protein